jgi:hypothetical protein
MSQIDQVTQRNASASEELSSTAEELALQAESFQQLMAFFRVHGSDRVGATPRRAQSFVTTSGPMLPIARPAAIARSMHGGGNGHDHHHAHENDFQPFGGAL